MTMMMTTVMKISIFGCTNHCYCIIMKFFYIIIIIIIITIIILVITLD